MHANIHHLFYFAISRNLGLAEMGRNVIENYLPETVILLVSYSSDGDGLVISSNKKPKDSTETNLSGLINVIELCKNFHCKLIWTCLLYTSDAADE